MIRISLRKRLHTAEGDIQLMLNMEISPSKFISLYGRSGSGKTTLLRMLAGLTDPDAGFIRVGSHVWFDSEKGINLSPQKRRVGMVFQDYALFPHLSVRQNLEFALERGESRERVEEIMDIVGLRPFENRRPATLSGGQKQKVALGRALVTKPQILLLDEPLSAIDGESRLMLQNEIATLQRKYGVATILVSHDIAEIFRLSQQVFFIERGRITRSGNPEMVFLRQHLSGKFKFTGILLDIADSDAVKILTILIGNDIVKVASIPQDTASLAVGDKVLVSSKAFNPLVLKID